MKAHTDDTAALRYQPDDEAAWHDLYTWLFPRVEKWVRNASVNAWYGQQREVSEDITQEAVLRTFRYCQRAVHGEVRPIDSLKSLGKTIAQNYFRDRRKKDWNLVRPAQESENTEGFLEVSSPLERSAPSQVVDPSQVAVDRVMLTTVISMAARILVKFPPGQRAALLTDLANITDFGEYPTLLEQALAEAGVELKAYQHPLPTEPGEKNRHAALLSIAYKRLRREVAV